MTWTHGAIAALLALSAAACSSGESADGETSPPPPGSPPPSGNATISVDSSQQFQTMSGWEVTAYLEEFPGESGTPQAVFNEMISRAVTEIGIDRVRLEVRAGAEKPDSGFQAYASGGSSTTWREVRYATVNDNTNPNSINAAGFDFSELDFYVNQVVLPMRAALQAQGKTLFINICYVAFTAQNAPGSQYHHNDPAEYAEFVLAVHQHLDQTFGLRPDTWEVMLEPDNSGATQNWDGVDIGQRIVAAGQRLQAAGYATKFVAPSVLNMAQADDYFNDMLTVTGAVGRIAELSYHRYGGNPTADLPPIVQLGRANNVRTSMLECWHGIGCNADQATLRQELVLGEASSFQGRTLRGMFDVVGGQTVLRDDVRYNRQYYHFVDRGAVRVAATSSNGVFAPVAFINPDGRYVVVVNASNGGSLSVGGLPAGDYGVQYTTSSEAARDLSDVFVGAGVALQTSIPASGVVTIYGK